MYDLVRRHAEIYLSSLAVMAIVDMGDFKAAENFARRSLVKLLSRLPEARRQTIVHRLGIEMRTFDAWKAQAKEEELEQTGLSAEELEARRTASTNIRFFVAAMRALHEAGNSFVSVGTITDRVNEILEPEEEFSVVTVKSRLEMYVGLGQLERHPKHRERYRLAVLSPRLIDDEVAFREQVLEAIFPSLYRVTFQILAGAAGAGMRSVFFMVPEGKEERLTSAFQAAYGRLIDEMFEVEAALSEEFSETPKHAFAFHVLHGRDPLGTETRNKPLTKERP